MTFWRTRLARPAPLRLALFQKRLDGDDALLQMARARFERVGLGAEVYAELPGDLEQLLRLCPARLPVAVHLPRDWSLLDPESLRRTAELAIAGRSRVFGLVLHDEPELHSRKRDYVQALRAVDGRLDELPAPPTLFVEYACGHPPERFAALFESVADLAHVSACVDIGHVAIQEARTAYERIHQGQELCSITPDDPGLPSLLRDVQAAVGTGRDAAFALVARMARLGKALHVHLHDGHPLSATALGLSDHQSFLAPVPIGIEWRGRTALDPMFGPHGLLRVVQESLAAGDPELVSLSLEIHPTEGRSPLGKEEPLFRHWTNLTNAERMSFWLDDLVRHGVLLDAACETAVTPAKMEGHMADV